MRLPMAKILLLLTLAMAVVFAGCSRDSSVTNPNPKVFEPKGTIQGAIVDKATKNPIKGAVVNIGVAKTTTAEDGTFVLKNVAATQDALNGSVWGKYTVTVDLRKAEEVCGPQAIGSCGQFPYPDFTYRGVAVEYTSLDDTDTNYADVYSNHSNHDTPVQGLVATLGIEVGKLSAGIAGGLTYCLDVHNKGYNTVAEDCTVQVISTNYDDLCDVGECEEGPNSFTGDKGNIIATVDTTNAAFSFSGLEALTEYALVASCGGGTLVGEFEDGGHHYYHNDAVKTLSEGTTDGSFCVSYADQVKPIIKHVTPENGASIGNVTSATVIWEFSEPIAQTALTNPTNVSNCGVTKRVEVEFEGQVWEGLYQDIPYTVEWLNDAELPCSGTDCTKLKVSLPTLSPASIYSVKIDDVLDPHHSDDELVQDCPLFTDLAGNPLCDEGDGPMVLASLDGGWYGHYCDGDPYNKSEVRMYTITDCDPLAPLSVSALNQPYDYEDTVYLDWLVATCAKEYQVTEQCDELWNGTRIAGQKFLIDSTNDTEDAVDGDFIDSGDCTNIPLECTYCVKSVGPDTSLSSDEECVTVADTQEPQLEEVEPDTGASDFINGEPEDTFILTFSEPLDEETAETASNYTLDDDAFVDGTAPTVADAIFSCSENGPFEVVLVLSEEVSASDINESEIHSGTANNICSYLTSGDDTEYVPNNSGGICVEIIGPTDADTDDNVGGVGDDVTTTLAGVTAIFSGANGICNSVTGAAENDIQVVAVNTATPNDIICSDAGTNFITQNTPLCILPGTNATIESVPGGDDVQNGNSYISAGSNRICETTLSGDDVATGDYVKDFLWLTIDGVTDVAGNPLDTDTDEVDTNSNIH